MAEDTQTNILKELFRHIYIEKGQIKHFNFSFLGWGLKVTLKFEKLRPPHGFSNVPIWILDFFVFFSFFIMTPPLNEMKQNDMGPQILAWWPF